MVENSLIQKLCTERIERDLSCCASEDQLYQAANEEADKKLDEILRMCEEESLRDAIDDLIAAHNYSCSKYAEVAYRVGFCDGVTMFAEIIEILYPAILNEKE